MTDLKTVTVNSDGTVASVGSGASWLDVYLYLDALGLSVAGGRNGAVGVGGLTLGGGISYFAPRVGWACDNVVNLEVRPTSKVTIEPLSLHSRSSLHLESSPMPTQPHSQTFSKLSRADGTISASSLAST